MSKRRVFPLVLAVAGALCIGHAAFLPAKALVGQAMMAHAWMRAQDGEARAKPWPWADTWPVARLSVPAHDVALTVLRGAQGESLAWGPGHVDGTALPGFLGNAAVGGHRDTSFRFLKDVSVGERVVVERPDGETVTYEVTDAAVMNETDTRALASSPGRVLTLITCYPFDTPVPGGPLRYVVRAVEAG